MALSLAQISGVFQSSLAAALAFAARLPRSHSDWQAALLATASSPTALARWLALVAALRLFSTACAACAPGLLRRHVYGGRGGGAAFTPLAARIFGAWCAVTAFMCLAAALTLRTPAGAPMCALAAATFVIALLHFARELLAHGSSTLGNVVSPAIVAGASV